MMRGRFDRWRGYAGITLILLLFLLGSSPSLSALPVDSLKMGWLGNGERSLQWELLDAHLELTGGERKQLLLPEQSLLRVEVVEGALFDHQLRLWLGDGSGLLQEIPWHDSGDGWFEADLNRDQLSMIQLEMDPSVTAQVALRLMSGGRLREPFPPLYRSEAVPDLPAVDLVRDAPKLQQRYYLLKAGEETVLEAEEGVGSCRLRIDSRLLWPQSATALELLQQLTLQVGEAPPYQMERHPGIDQSGLCWQGRCQQLLGSEESHWLNLAQGERVRVSGNRDLLLRSRWRCDSDLLFSGINGAAQKRGEGDEPWKILPRNRSQIVADERGHEAPFPADFAQQLQGWYEPLPAMVRDPREEEAPLQAAAALRQLQQMKPLSGEWGREADRIEGRWSHYRDLLPERWGEGESDEGGRVAYFPQQTLRAAGDPNPAIQISQPLLAAALNRLPSAQFFQLKGGEALHYPLPPRSAPSRLRLLLQGPSTVEMLFSGEVEGQPRQWRSRFTMRDREEQRQWDLQFAENLALTALASLPHKGESAVTMSPAFGRYRLQAPLWAAGSGVVELPPWVASIALRPLAGDPPLAALQLRVADSPKVTEDELLQAWHEPSLRNRPWQNHLREGEVDRMVALFFRPFRRWLELQRRQFAAGIAPLATLQSPQLPLSTTFSAAIVAGRRAEANGDWSGALRYWRQVVAAADASSEEKLTAWRAIWHGLQQLAEPRLRQQLLKGVVVEGESAQLRAEAESLLEADYHAEGEEGALLRLAAWRLNLNPTSATLQQLISLLLAEENYLLAFRALLLLPPEEVDPQQLFTAALHNGWYRLAAEAVSRLQGEARALAEGWLAWHRGDHEFALEQWQQANEAGRALLLARSRGLRLEETTREKLADHDAALAEWWSSHPGPYRWQSDGITVERSRGALGYRGVASEQRLRYYLAQPQQPVVMSVTGPLTLEVELRTLHQQPQQRVDGWATITINDHPLPIPFSDHPVSASLQGESEREPLPGVAQIRIFHLPPGPQRLEIGSATLPLLVRARSRQPLSLLAAPPRPTRTHPYHPPPATVEEVVTALVYRAESDPQQRQRLEVAAELIAHHQPLIGGLQPLLQRLRRQSEWRPQTHLISAAGLRRLPKGHPLPQSPSASIRAALLTPGAEESRLLSGNRRLVLMTDRPRSERYQLLIELLATPFLPLQEVALTLSGGGQERQILLNEATPVQRLALHLPPGEQQRSIALDQGVVGHSVRLTLLDRGGQPLPWDEYGRGEEIVSVATAEEPLQAMVEGPAWLRIDAYQADHKRHFYYPFPEGWNRLRLGPLRGEKGSLYRLFVRSPLAQPSQRPRSLHLWREESALLDANPPSSGPELAPLPLWIGTQRWVRPEPETASRSLAWRRTVRRDEGALSSWERFHQLSLSDHRYSSLQRTREEWGVLLRHHDEGEPLLGGWFERNHLSPLRPFSWRVGAEGLLQEIPQQGMVAGLRVEGGISRLDHLTPHWDNLFDLSPKFYLLSLARHRWKGDEVADSDLLSRYLYDHRQKLVARQQLDYRPWLDSRLSLQWELTTNEQLNPFAPEKVALSGRWHQLLGRAMVSGGYRWRRYFADDDRTAASDRYGPGLTLMWESRLRPYHRLQWKLSLEHEQTEDESSGYLQLNWLQHDGGLRHLPSAERQFRDLRLWNWSEHEEE
ncbi:MAG: hypothetical protein HQL48_00320 [Gammaproteobacteria bacterium]|nr:hypothetical protein [Gammaproteobacteria bacterium]